MDLIVGAGEIHRVPAQQSHDDGQRLFEAADQAVRGIAERMQLERVVAGAQPEDQATLADFVTVSAILASKAGFRKAVQATRVPTSTREVTAASADRSDQPSQTPRGCSAAASSGY